MLSGEQKQRAIALKLAVKTVNKKTAHSPTQSARSAIELAKEFESYISGGN